jgi:hypothetical protein
LSPDFVQLAAHVQRECDRSVLLCGRSQALIRQARLVRLVARQLTIQIAAHRAAQTSTKATVFDRAVSWRLEGCVDGEPVWAAWEAGRLACHDSLRACVEAVVALDDRWFDEVTGEWIPATTIGPSDAVLLTALRACSTVRSVRVKLPHRDVS